MFSEDILQEVAALLLAVGALLYVVRKLTGWPRRKPKETPVAVSERLARGLEKAKGQKSGQ